MLLCVGSLWPSVTDGEWVKNNARVYIFVLRLVLAGI